MKSLVFLGVAACLLASGCVPDSKSPLSDPQTSKADERLLGVWREEGNDCDMYYHIGHAGEKFPNGVMRFVQIEHSKDAKEQWSPAKRPSSLLRRFGGKSYLNVVCDDDPSKNGRAALGPERLESRSWWTSTASSSTNSTAANW